MIKFTLIGLVDILPCDPSFAVITCATLDNLNDGAAIDDCGSLLGARLIAFVGYSPFHNFAALSRSGRAETRTLSSLNALMTGRSSAAEATLCRNPAIVKRAQPERRGGRVAEMDAACSFAASPCGAQIRHRAQPSGPPLAGVERIWRGPAVSLDRPRCRPRGRGNRARRRPSS